MLSREHSTTRDLLGQVRGTVLEGYYHHRLPSFLGRRMGRTRALLPYELLDELEARLSSAATDDVLLADLIVRGQYPRGQAENWDDALGRHVGGSGD
jgi:hypothetical protein